MCIRDRHNADSLATRWEKEQYMFSKDSDIKYAEILQPALKVEREEQEKESVDNIKKAIKTLRGKLMRKAHLITPNIPEAEVLTKTKIKNLEED